MLIEVHGTGCPVLRGVAVGVQRGREVVDEHAADGTDKRWTLDVAAIGDDVRGPYVHGTKGARFVYLSWQRVGQGMFRRAKLMLDEMPPGERVTLSVPLTMPDGSPLCAAVRAPVLAWSGGELGR